jgi:hypothetical protein
LSYFLLKTLLVSFVVADEGRQALVSLELGNLIVKSFYFSGNEFPYIFALLAAVDPVLRVLPTYFIDNLPFKSLKFLVDETIELFFALCKLFADVVRQALDIV